MGALSQQFALLLMDWTIPAALMSLRYSVAAALSDYQIERVTNLLARRAHAAATTSRHVCIADALKARCVFPEVRWRWTLKALYAAAWVELSSVGIHETDLAG